MTTTRSHDITAWDALDLTAWDAPDLDTGALARFRAPVRVQLRKLHLALRRVGWVIRHADPDAGIWQLDRRGDGRRIELLRRRDGRWCVQVSDLHSVLHARNPLMRSSLENRAEVHLTRVDYRLLEDDAGRRTMEALTALAVASRYAADNPGDTGALVTP